MSSRRFTDTVLKTRKPNSVHMQTEIVVAMPSSSLNPSSAAASPADAPAAASNVTIIIENTSDEEDEKDNAEPLRLRASYFEDLAKIGGVHWTKSEASFMNFKGMQRARIFTIPEFPPGTEHAPYPTTLPELGISDSKQDQRAAFKSQLLATYDASVAGQDWSYALRCAIVAEIIRRTGRIHASRGEPALSDFRAHGGVYHAAAALPPLPQELRPVFHGIAYGSSPRELAFMQAIGVQPSKNSVAGFEPLSPLHVVVRTRNAKTKRLVHVPAVIAKASISESDNNASLETLVRGCRDLVAACDLYADADTPSPLCLLELQVLACIPSGRIHLRPGGSTEYEHLFGVANDTRRFWLTSYNTDRLQYPCAVVDRSVFSPPCNTFIEPARAAVMVAMREQSRAEEHAMFQIMLGVCGIDRMFVGRAFAWREAPGATDDLAAIKHVGIYPQWLPQALFSFTPASSPPQEEEDPLLPPPPPPSSPPRTPPPASPVPPEPLPPQQAEAEEEDDATTFDGLGDLDWLFAAAAASPKRKRNAEAASTPPTLKKKKRVLLRPADEEPTRVRAFRGSGRVVIERDVIVEWAKASIASGVVQGGSCTQVCPADQPGVQPRGRYTITPGVVIGIVDAVVSEAVERMNEARAELFVRRYPPLAPSGAVVSAAAIVVAPPPQVVQPATYIDPSAFVAIVDAAIADKNNCGCSVPSSDDDGILFSDDCPLLLRTPPPDEAADNAMIWAELGDGLGC